MNWLMLLATWCTGRYHSPVPLIGAAFLGVGALLHPALRPYAWAAVLIDAGTLAIVPALPRIVREMWETSRFNLEVEYIGRRDATTVSLRLFRRGIFTIRWEIKRPPGEYGLVGMGNIGTWEREADTLILRIGADHALFGPLPGEPDAGWYQLTGFDHCKRPELSLEGLELRRVP
jgi:hypothetical protein